MRRFPLLHLAWLLAGMFLTQAAVFAQIHDQLHWVFPVDSVAEVRLDLVDPFEVANWEGNQVMVTSEITVYNASKGIMRFFIEENKRYDVVADTLQPQQILRLKSYQSRRAPIQSKGETCYEQIQVKIFLPTNFAQVDGKLWRRKEE
jgi:hypothetical protein